MTGQPQPTYRTDDIRRTVGALLDSRPATAVVTAGIVASAVALLVQSFAPNLPLDGICAGIVAWCIGIFAVEVSLRLIAQRAGFFGKLGNIALFLIVGWALFTPFKAVLMLRLFPLMKHGIRGHALPAAVQLPLMLLWLAACLGAAAREFVLFHEGACAGWMECVGSAVTLAIP